VRRLLSERDADCRIPHGPYKKWNGDWVLSSLADLGCPSEDAWLILLRDQVYDLWLAPEHTREYVCTTRTSRAASKGVPLFEGRARRCASQEGTALYSTLTVGLADSRADELARNLMRWQWPDGGWNCDRKRTASNSSFWESLIPMCALALYACETGDGRVKAAVD